MTPGPDLHWLRNKKLIMTVGSKKIIQNFWLKANIFRDCENHHHGQISTHCDYIFCRFIWQLSSILTNIFDQPMNWYFCEYFVSTTKKICYLLFFRINKDINIIFNPCWTLALSGWIINLLAGAYPVQRDSHNNYLWNDPTNVVRSWVKCSRVF